MITSGPKVVTRLWNQLKTSGTVPSKVAQGHHRASTPAEDCYLALRSRRHMQTMAPHLARDLAAESGRRISRQTIYSRPTETDLYPRRPVWSVSLTAFSRKDGY
ncbi:hypothetical protein TNCV_2863091 [Trichonephila clavipes]|nr:hypothetical protein TNCV_2863091 [Trichonephila clavipes]